MSQRYNSRAVTLKGRIDHALLQDEESRQGSRKESEEEGVTIHKQ